MTLQITILSDEGREYPIEVTPETTIEALKRMAVGHFFSMSEVDRLSKDQPDYQLIILNDSRRLDPSSTVRLEYLKKQDTLLLVPKRNDVSEGGTDGVSNDESRSDNKIPTSADITTATAHLTSANEFRVAEVSSSNEDYKTELCRILLALIEVSATMIALEPNYEDNFNKIFARLERRHKANVSDNKSLKQLTDMGFSDEQAVHALQTKRNVEDALNYLLDLKMNTMELLEYDGGQNLTAVGKFMQRFKKYRRTWCPTEVIKENAETPLDRNHKFVSAILQSYQIQVALSQPKTLLALLSICENPNNTNVWLSDLDTNTVVSQILRIYHAEKYSNPNNRTINHQSSLPQQDDSCNIYKWPVPHLHMGKEELLSHYPSRQNMPKEIKFQTNIIYESWNSYGIFGPIPDYIRQNKSIHFTEETEFMET